MLHPLTLFKLSLSLLRKNGFLIAERQIEFLSLYSFAKSFLQKQNGPLYLVNSSESNPESMAFSLAARDLGYKTVYVSHGFLGPELGLFAQDLIIVDYPVLTQRIAQSHIHSPKFLTYKKPSQKSLKPAPVNSPIEKVGIILSLVPDKEALIDLIKTLKIKLRSPQIEIRKHPNSLYSKALLKQLEAESGITLFPALPWSAFHPNWDFAVAGNTSAHIDLILKGIPCAYSKIDAYPEDYYHFVGQGLIPRLNDLSPNIADALTSFYESSQWIQLFKNSYLGKEEQIDEKLIKSLL